jgi:hypothetical protein
MAATPRPFDDDEDDRKMYEDLRAAELLLRAPGAATEDEAALFDLTAAGAARREADAHRLAAIAERRVQAKRSNFGSLVFLAALVVLAFGATVVRRLYRIVLLVDAVITSLVPCL